MEAVRKRVVFLLFFLLIKVRLVTIHELIHPTSGVHKFHLARIERVGGVGDLQFDQRIFIAIFELDGFLRRSSRFGDKRESVGHVPECYKPVIFRMYIFLHYACFF